MLSNTYDLSALWGKIHELNKSDAPKQMSLFDQTDLDVHDAGLGQEEKKSVFERFGQYARSLLQNGFIFVPRNLDEFQDKLSLSTHELLFIKYLFGYMDESGTASISLNIMIKHLPISKSAATGIVSSLVSK